MSLFICSLSINSYEALIFKCFWKQFFVFIKSVLMVTEKNEFDLVIN